MKTWTPSELEDGLLDYLYDELEPDDRSAFERALEARPELLAELERHRVVRAAARGLAPVPVPTVALQNVLAAADAEAERRRHLAEASAAGGAGFWTRVRGWFMHPAFATASVALIVAGVGLTMSQRGGSTEGDARNDQSVPARLREPVAVHDDKVATTPAGSGAAVSVGSEKRDLEREAQGAPVGQGAADPVQVAEKRAGAAEVPAATKEALAPPPFGPRPPSQPVAGRTETGLEDEAAKPSAHTAHNAAEDSGNGAGGVVTGGAPLEKKAVEDKPAPGFAGDADVTSKDGLVAADSAKAKQRDEGARAKVAEIAATLDTSPKSDNTAGPRRADVSPSPRPEDAKNELKTTLATPQVESYVADKKPEDAGRAVVQNTPSNQSKTPVVAPRAPDANSANNGNDRNTQSSTSRLWTTYGQQMAAGAWTDAAKTLSEIEKFGTESARVTQARAELKKRAQVAAEPAKADGSKLPDPGLKPTTDTKTNKP